MYKYSATYTSDNRVRDILEDNSQLLLVLNRFKIPFGFGNSTIEDICADNKIDTSTFLAVANIVSGRSVSDAPVHLPDLMGYLRYSHSYILDFSLPNIRDILIKGVHQSQLDNVALLIIKFFDEYMEEVHNHMDYEDNVVFPYIEQLQNGIISSEFRIDDFADHHDSAVLKLNELKDIFLQHYALPNTRLLSKALIHISECGDDLVSHCEIEDKLLVPAVKKLEATVFKKVGNRKPVEAQNFSSERFEALSEREKEIIRLVSHGLSNKEIADRLCLSFHTITTYRKNITSKLNIHSSAALTIFAILHNIVDPKEIELK